MSETSENPTSHGSTDAGGAAIVPQGRSRKRPAVYLAAIVGVSLLVLAADQLSKVWAQGALVAGEPSRPLVGDLIGLRLIYNSGAALSFGAGMTWVLTLLSAGVVVFIVASARRIRSTRWAVALGLVLGGALGNLADRLFRAPGFPEGHVVDFIDYGPFIGNVADIAIVGAAVLIAIFAFSGLGPDGVRAGTGPAVASSEPEASSETGAASDTDVSSDDDTAGQGSLAAAGDGVSGAGPVVAPVDDERAP